ncbi:MAG: hypothetical protein HC817_03555 [Saprospiraceae bacterium]|nr:hypothetical protein [Saprospiraceae bacterium]
MKKQCTWLIGLALTMTLTQCSRCKENITPSVRLPPETQTGAGTFACLINGEVWTYKDPTGITLKPATYWEVDLQTNGGTLQIEGLRYDNDNKLIDRAGLLVDSILSKNQIILDKNIEIEVKGVCYRKGSSPRCDDYCPSPDSKDFPYRNGKVTITKFNQQSRIIAGRFECTLLRQKLRYLKKLLRGGSI